MSSKSTVLISIILVELIIIASMGWLLLNPSKIITEPLKYGNEKILLEIAIGRTQYKIGEKINVTATLTNLKPEHIIVYALDVQYSLDSFLVLPNNTMVVGGYNYSGIGYPAILPENWTLEPGEKRSYTFNLTDLIFVPPHSGPAFLYPTPYRFNKVGRHYLWCRYLTENYLHKSYDFIFSNVIEFDVIS